MGKVSWWRTMGATDTRAKKMISMNVIRIKISNKMIPKEMFFLMIDTDKLRLIIGIAFHRRQILIK